MLVLAMCVAGPFFAHRHVPLAMLAIAILTAQHAADLRARITAPAEGSPSRLAWLTTGVIAAPVLILIAAAVPHFGRIRMGHPSIELPAAGIAVLKEAGLRGNIAVPFSWGEYVIWHLGPAVKVSIDGRRETVYSEEIYAENLRFVYGRTGWDDLVARPETALVLTDRGRECDRLMGGRIGWEAVYEDLLCRIFARAGSAEADSLRRVRPGDVDPPQEFPG